MIIFNNKKLVIPKCLDQKVKIFTKPLRKRRMLFALIIIMFSITSINIFLLIFYASCLKINLSFYEFCE